MMREELISGIEEMDRAIEWAQMGLKDAPEGKLLIDVRGDDAKYYWRKQPSEKKGTYLSKEEDALIRGLAQKEYEIALMRVAEKAKERLSKMLETCDKGQSLEQNVLASVYDELPSQRKVLVEPYALNDDDYAARWLQQECESNGHAFSAGGFFSRDGVQVRSKSEVIIADLLEAAGVPYRYEQALFIGGYSPVYPDFTVLNKRTRQEYVWEHLGAMDDPDYCQSALAKLNRYALAGYLPGDKLIVTQESAREPLDTRVVQALIERFLK